MPLRRVAYGRRARARDRYAPALRRAVRHGLRAVRGRPERRGVHPEQQYQENGCIIVQIILYSIATCEFL